jgi:glycosyltransferase involved in cell wall biosynthesis
MKISVIIPTYNRIFFLKRSIDSVLEQILKPYEVIIVDDGSSDGTSTMIKKNYPKINLICQENKGVSAARNIGIRASSGDWVCFLDSDDEWKKNKLSEQMLAIKKNTNYSFCHSNEEWIKNGKKINQKKKHKKYGGNIFKECLDMCRISPSSVMINKSVFDDIGFFNEDLVVCEDYELWLRICAHYKVLFVDEPLIIKYGGHEGQLSNSIESIEYYRIKALEYLLSTEMTYENKKEAVKILLFKLGIYLNGLKKRNKILDIVKYNKKIKFWNKVMFE